MFRSGPGGRSRLDQVDVTTIGAGGLLIRRQDLFVNLFTVHRDIAWRFDAYTYLIAARVEDGDSNGPRDDDRLALFPGQNQHGRTPSRASMGHGWSCNTT